MSLFCHPRRLSSKQASSNRIATRRSPGPSPVSGLPGKNRTRILTRSVVSIGIAAPVLLNAFQYYAAATTPHYDWVSQTISHLASPGMPHPMDMRAAIVSYHLVMILLASLAWRLVGHDKRLVPGFFFFVFYVACGLSTGFFQDDSNAVVAFGVTAGTVHSYSAYFTLAVFGLAVLSFAGGTFQNRQSRWFPEISLVVFLLGMAVALPLPLDVWRHWHGALERIVFFLAGAWIAAFSFYVFKAGSQLEQGQAARQPGENLSVGSGLRRGV